MAHIRHSRITFILTEDEYQKFIEWQREVDARVYEQQNNLAPGEITPDGMSPLDIESGRYSEDDLHPDYGVGNGVYQFRFGVSTFITRVEVVNRHTGDTLDLTDWDNI